MNLTRGGRVPAIAIVTLTALMLVACSSNPDASDGPDDGGDGQSAGEGLSGEIVVSGSSTVEPITSIAIEDFTANNPGRRGLGRRPWHGRRIRSLLRRRDRHRRRVAPISDEEIALCEEAGITYVELQIGIDGISVITSPENDAVSCLSFADLYALTGPESQGFDNWTDADALAQEIGSGDFGEIHAPFPANAPLTVAAPGEESGTYDTYVEFVIADLAEERGADEATRPDYQTAADDNVIIENIAGSPTTLGWVGFAFADESSDSVTSLEVDGGDGCVAPTPETIASGEYPMSRPLFIYVNAAEADGRPEVSAFVDFFLSDEGIAAVTEADYVALDEAALEETRAAWTDR